MASWERIALRNESEAKKWKEACLLCKTMLYNVYNNLEKRSLTELNSELDKIILK